MYIRTGELAYYKRTDVYIQTHITYLIYHILSHEIISTERVFVENFEVKASVFGKNIELEGLLPTEHTHTQATKMLEFFLASSTLTVISNYEKNGRRKVKSTDSLHTARLCQRLILWLSGISD